MQVLHNSDLIAEGRVRALPPTAKEQQQQEEEEEGKNKLAAKGTAKPFSPQSARRALLHPRL